MVVYVVRVYVCVCCTGVCLCMLYGCMFVYVVRVYVCVCCTGVCLCMLGEICSRCAEV